jgi:DNA-binding NtrC family response regulator
LSANRVPDPEDHHAGGKAEITSLFLGASAAAQRVRKLIRRAARVDSTVLITGESGVGKELVAREIHLRSARASQPFLPLNCAAIPDTLVEAEIFGHEAGAFTGARARHRGAFELSHGGTLFLDEIGDLSSSAQPKLLRVLETGELVRVGGERPQQVDLRVIAATNHQLKQMVRDDLFRADLYYRLCVFEVRVPPLKERLSDIPMLAEHFAGTLAKKTGREHTRISSRALEILSEQPWPGNVRQLKHVVESAMAMNSGFVLDSDCFELQSLPGTASLGGLLERDWRAAREGFEAAYVKRLLARYGGNVAKAAQAAGLARRSFYKILKRLGLQPGPGSS